MEFVGEGERGCWGEWGGVVRGARKGRGKELGRNE